jgi:hypothetical protein
MLGHGVGRVTRDPDHRDAEALGCFDREVWTLRLDEEVTRAPGKREVPGTDSSPIRTGIIPTADTLKPLG